MADDLAPVPVADNAPTPTPAPPTSGVFDSLPDDLKSHPTLAKFKEGGITGLATSYINLERAFSGDKVAIPKGDNPDAWAMYNKAIGVPDTPDKYELKRPELPEGVQYDEESEKWFRAEAHKQGLTPKQVTALFNAEIARRLEQHTEYARTNKEAIATSNLALKKEFGDAYDGALNTADTALREYGGDELLGLMKQAGIAHHPSVIRAFSKIGRDLIGAGKLKGDGAGSPTPQEAKMRAATYRREHAAILDDKLHPEFQARFAEYTKLNEQAFGKEPWMA